MALGSQITQITQLAVLDKVDHFIKEVLRIKFYYRCMDDFIFDGRILSGYGYMICSFYSVGIEKLPVSNSTFNTIKSPLSKSSKKVSINDEENLQKVIQICKKKCNNEYMEISTDEISELTRWLCRSEYKWIQFLSNKGIKL